MPMNNLDDKNILSQNIVDAIKTNDEAQIAKAFEEYAKSVHDTMMSEIENGISAVDSMILARRNQRQLTSSEVKFYNELISALKSDEPKKNITALSKKISVKQAVDNLDVAYPETIFESVISDIRQSHELLQYIDFRYTTILTTWIRNTAQSQLAQWGKINSEVTKELEGSIEEINIGMNKLTAWIPMYKDMLDLGPVWVDAYIREILREAISIAIETAIVCGDGADCPIGMNRDISEGVSVVNDAYPEKDLIKVSNFDVETYGELLAMLSKNSVTGKNRKIDNLILVVNPATYFKKVKKATSFLTPSGAYATDVLPHPTQIIQSVAVEDDRAILGLGKNYFFGLGSSKDGLLEYSDEVKFLEDLRVFKIKTHGNGMASDNNDFLYLDISNLQALAPKVVNT